MAEDTPRTSTRVKKSYSKTSISSFPESPLGATPRPDLRQHYPSPPPMTDFKSTYSVREFTADSFKTGNNDPDFTQLRKKTTEYKIKEWTTDYKDLKPEGSTRKALVILAFIFLAALAALGMVYSRFPRP